MTVHGGAKADSAPRRTEPPLRIPLERRPWCRHRKGIPCYRSIASRSPPGYVLNAQPPWAAPTLAHVASRRHVRTGRLPTAGGPAQGPPGQTGL